MTELTDEEVKDSYVSKHSLDSLASFPEERKEKILKNISDLTMQIKTLGIAEISSFVTAVRDAREVSNAADIFCSLLLDSKGEDIPTVDIDESLFVNCCIMGFLSSMFEVIHLREVALSGLEEGQHFRELLDVICKKEASKEV